MDEQPEELSQDERIVGAWRQIVTAPGTPVISLTRAVLAELVEVAERGLAAVASLSTEMADLQERLDAVSLRSIEASNPGIDMDEVRRLRAERSAS